MVLQNIHEYINIHMPSLSKEKRIEILMKRCACYWCGNTWDECACASELRKQENREAA